MARSRDALDDTHAPPVGHVGIPDSILRVHADIIRHAPPNQATGLFGPGRLTLDLPRARRVAPPHPYRPCRGRPHPPRRGKNSDTFDSLCTILATNPTASGQSAGVPAPPSKPPSSPSLPSPRTSATSHTSVTSVPKDSKSPPTPTDSPPPTAFHGYAPPPPASTLRYNRPEPLDSDNPRSAPNHRYVRAVSACRAGPGGGLREGAGWCHRSGAPHRSACTAAPTGRRCRHPCRSRSGTCSRWVTGPRHSQATGRTPVGIPSNSPRNASR